MFEVWPEGNQTQPTEKDSSENLEDHVEENSSEIEEEIKNLNDLVKSMEYSKNDVNARQAAQSAAVAVLEKMQRRKNNAITKNENMPLKSSSSEDLVGKEITIGSRNALRNSRDEVSEHERSKDIVDTVYLRDQNWELPDLVPQLEAWNSQTSLFFTKEYEDELISDIFDDDLDDNEQKKS